MNSVREWLASQRDSRWVRLFEGDGLAVSTFDYGRSARRTLLRADEFDEAIVDVIETGLRDPAFRGLLYVMAWGSRDSPYPLYIGKAGRFGKDGTSTSANLVGIRTNKSKFARWGYGNDYHLGDLSQAVFGWTSYKTATQKYEAWADLLFAQKDPPVLREATSVLLVPWYQESVGIDGDRCSVEAAEEQLISAALDEFPDTVLNVSGENWWDQRASPRASGEPAWSNLRETRWVETAAGLQELCDELMFHPVVAVDVETTIYPSRLALLQLGTSQFNAIVDPVVLTDLTPLRSVLDSTDIIKVIHNASFERRVLGERGLQIRRVFDTLSTSRKLRGNQKSHSLVNVVSREMNRGLDKTQQMSDWSRRPLTRQQLEYAAADVEVLLHLYEIFAPETEPTLPLLNLPPLTAATGPTVAVVTADPERDPVHIFGNVAPTQLVELRSFLRSAEGLQVTRASPARSSNAQPQSTDLELAMKPLLEDAGFRHHLVFQHPGTTDGFEFDFWREADGVAVEVMGYRADDEIYKDVLKFHVHPGTRLGVVFVPRYKWISGRRTDTNYSATLKALAFTETYLDVDGVVAIAYQWNSVADDLWSLSLFSSAGRWGRSARYARCQPLHAPDGLCTHGKHHD